MSKGNEVTKLAHLKGYRVQDDGTVIGLNGNIRSLTLAGRQECRYSVFNTNLGSHGNFPVRVHRLAAYQKFGEAVFQPGIVVRHLDGNPLNNRTENIAIGTQSDNAMDRPEKDRRDHASKGAQKFTPEFIQQIKEDHQSGLGYRKLQQKYGIARSTLSYYLSKTAKRTSYTFSEAQ